MEISNEEELLNEILKLQKILNISRMPTSIEVRDSKIVGLENAISKFGGYIEVANKFNLTSKCNRHSKWSEKEIQDGILMVISILNIKRMPSKPELDSVCGSRGLSVAMSKRNGCKWWSEKLNLPIKESETSFGDIWEEHCFNFLKTKYTDIERTWCRSPYDILINNKIRIDVKSATPQYGNISKCHTFALNKKIPTSDIYVLYAIGDDNITIEKTMIIPSEYVKQISISVGSKKSKYDEYLDRWDYIDNYL